MPTIIDTTAHRTENTNTPSENPRPLCAHMKILVAEDDGPVAEFLRQKLGQEQFAVQIASTGGEAQRLAGEQPFDMVLLDLNLNGATGLDVLRGLDAGADDYVAKPFAFAELAARIRA